MPTITDVLSDYIDKFDEGFPVRSMPSKQALEIMQKCIQDGKPFDDSELNTSDATY